MQQVPHLLWWHLGCPTVVGELEPTKTWHFQTRWVPWAMFCACLPPVPAECPAANNAGWSSRCFCHTTPCKQCSVGTLHPRSCRGCHTSALTLTCSSWYFLNFFFLSNSSCCVGIYISQMCTNTILLNAINTLHAHPHIYLFWPEPAGLCASQNNDAIRSYLFLFKNVSVLL